MSLPKILPISWSLSDDRNHPAAVPICSTAPSPFVAPVEACVVEAIKGVADFRRPGDSLPTNLNHLNSSNNHDCSTCLAHEIINWLPPPSEYPLSASPCTPCLRGSCQDPKSPCPSPLQNSSFVNRYSDFNISSYHSALSAIENYFKEQILPTTPIHLNPHTTIHDLPKFVSTHLSILNRYPGTREFLPYLHRLHALKYLLSNL